MARVAHASSISEESSSCSRSPKSSCRLLSPPHAYKLEYDRAAEGGEVGVTDVRIWGRREDHPMVRCGVADQCGALSG